MVNSLKLPLEIDRMGLKRAKSIPGAITDMIRALMTSPKWECMADPQFGFHFNNLRFEICNENDGTIYNSAPRKNGISEQSGLYEKKVSGLSKNVDTFAHELMDSISQFEPRLSDVKVSMTYIRQERNIYVRVRGVITESQEDYQYDTVIKLWN